MRDKRFGLAGGMGWDGMGWDGRDGGSETRISDKRTSGIRWKVDGGREGKLLQVGMWTDEIER